MDSFKSGIPQTKINNTINIFFNPFLIYAGIISVALLLDKPWHIQKYILKISPNKKTGPTHSYTLNLLYSKNPIYSSNILNNISPEQTGNSAVVSPIGTYLYKSVALVSTKTGITSYSEPNITS